MMADEWQDEWMVNENTTEAPRNPWFHSQIGQSVESTLGWVGTFAAVFLFLSAIPNVASFFKHKSTRSNSPFPFVCTWMNCALWCVYAWPTITPDRLQPLVCNGIGCAIFLTYMVCFLIFARGGCIGKLKIGALFLGAIVAPIVLLVCLAFVFKAEPEHYTLVLGIVCMLFNIGMYASPLSVLNVVIRSKSTTYLPYGMCIGCGVCSFTWLAYSLYVGDVNILVPNILGVLLFFTQTFIFLYYGGPKTWCQKGKKGEESSDADDAKTTLDAKGPQLSEPLLDSRPSDNNYEDNYEGTGASSSQIF